MRKGFLIMVLFTSSICYGGDVTVTELETKTARVEVTYTAEDCIKSFRRAFGRWSCYLKGWRIDPSRVITEWKEYSNSDDIRDEGRLKYSLFSFEYIWESPYGSREEAIEKLKYIMWRASRNGDVRKVSKVVTYYVE